MKNFLPFLLISFTACTYFEKVAKTSSNEDAAEPAESQILTLQEHSLKELKTTANSIAAKNVDICTSQRVETEKKTENDLECYRKITTLMQQEFLTVEKINVLNEVFLKFFAGLLNSAVSNIFWDLKSSQPEKDIEQGISQLSTTADAIFKNSEQNPFRMNLVIVQPILSGGKFSINVSSLPYPEVPTWTGKFSGTAFDDTVRFGFARKKSYFRISQLSGNLKTYRIIFVGLSTEDVARIKRGYFVLPVEIGQGDAAPVSEICDNPGACSVEQTAVAI